VVVKNFAVLIINDLRKFVKSPVLHKTSTDSMDSLSSSGTQNTTKKRIKATHTRQETSSKIIAFEVLSSLKHKKRSGRSITQLLEVPNSTMQSWRASETAHGVSDEVEAFFSTPCGAKFLQRMVLAAYQSIHFGCGGIRSLQEFLRLSHLNQFVASSDGALHDFSVRCEEHIIEVGEAVEKRLAAGLKTKKVTAALDEMFRGKHPCLVAIETVSNYILLEKFTEDRSAETWETALRPRLNDLNLDIQQVVSDQGSGIVACAKALGAEHTPELFHAQQELTKATSAPLSKQEKEFENGLNAAEEKLSKQIKRHGSNSQQAKEASIERNLKQYGLEVRQERRRRAKKAVKNLGYLYHPIDLKTGKRKRIEEIESGFSEQLNVIEECAREAELGPSCQKRLEKARRTFNAIVSSLKLFYLFYIELVSSLRLNEKQELFFNTVIFPLCYLQSIWKRLEQKEREELFDLMETLGKQFQTSVYSEELKQLWMKRGKECAEGFQRSSSCVEGRNGMLSLYHHRFHRLNTRGLKALTIVHNFHKRRNNGTTAAERLFGKKHENLFDSLVMNVRIPGRPNLKKNTPQKLKLEDENHMLAQGF
jgi:hypothetical protein